MDVEVGQMVDFNLNKPNYIKTTTKSLVVCHSCQKVLYQMPTTDLNDNFGRVARSRMRVHQELSTDHDIEIVYTKENIDVRKRGQEYSERLMAMIYTNYELI